MRDTDADWVTIGQTQPFFGVLTNPAFLQENLSEHSLAEFWKAGQQDVDSLLGMVRHHDQNFAPRTALDFGCGVGRLVRALATEVDRVTGVDISPGMLEQARRYAPINARFLDALPDEQFDLITSHIVFQHIPPSRGYSLFRDLLSRLNIGGAFAIQVTIYRERNPLLGGTLSPVLCAAWDGESVRTYEENPHPPGTMLMHDYDLGHLVCIAHRSGVESLHMVHTDHGGHHGVIISGRRSA